MTVSVSVSVCVTVEVTDVCRRSPIVSTCTARTAERSAQSQTSCMLTLSLSTSL